MRFSIALPWIFLHWRGFRYMGTSRRYGKGRLVHYNARGKVTGKTVDNRFGEPNHLDAAGNATGYSRYVKRGRYVHFDSRGSQIGYSRRIALIFWIHRN